MNEGRPYLQMWRGVWVPFCKITIVSFLSIRYKSEGLYCEMPVHCTTHHHHQLGFFSTPTPIKDLVGDDGGEDACSSGCAADSAVLFDLL